LNLTIRSVTRLRCNVTLGMIQTTATVATTVSPRSISMSMSMRVIATEFVERFATPKPRTGVMRDMTPTGVGRAIGARTKAREVVSFQFPYMGVFHLLVIIGFWLLASGFGLLATV